jgi:hypothetical protein
MRPGLIWIVLLSTLFVGCKDKAKDPYAQCVRLDAEGNVKGAWESCGAAVTADPNSTSGKAATAKLTEMKPKYDAWKKADDEKQAKEAEARRKANEEARAREAVAAAERIQVLRRKIHKETAEVFNDKCAAQGKPAHGYKYGGGTYAENEQVYKADGCVLMEFGSSFVCCP